MRRFLLGFGVLFIFSSQGFALPPGEEGVLHCTGVNIESMDQVLITVNPEKQGLAKIYVLKKDQEVDYIFVGIAEWFNRSVPLPREGKYNFRLHKMSDGWKIFQTSIDTSRSFKVNCIEN